MKKLSNKGQFQPLMAIFLLILLAGGVGAYLKFVLHISPGKLSGGHIKDEPLQGYISHADFETECQHCHAPVHCITAERCQDCHVEVARQRQEADGLHSRLPNTGRCTNCHIEHEGRDALITVFAYENVDHYALSDFSLALHKHGYQDNPLGCQSCHGQERYMSGTLDCVTCHVEADHAFMSQHVDLYGVSCVPCHDGRDRMANFNHDDIYVLEAGHQEAECTSCHLEKVFAGTTSTCSDCHEDPEEHAGQFGLECDRCHTAVARTPAYLTRHNFYLEHGNNGVENECATCHPDTCSSHTCYSCHEHQPEAIRESHFVEGIMEYGQCWECHPTGEPGEADALRQEQQQQDTDSDTIDAQSRQDHFRRVSSSSETDNDNSEAHNYTNANDEYDQAEQLASDNSSDAHGEETSILTGDSSNNQAGK